MSNYKWKHIHSSVIGLSHENGGVCQDSSSSGFIEKSGFSFAMVSDGCGSSPISQLGSALLTSELPKYVSRNFSTLINLDEKALKHKVISKILELIDKDQRINPQFLEFIKTDEFYELKNKDENDDLDDEFIFRSLYDATVLFVAIKDEKALLIHCGDGFIGKVNKGVLSILSCEKKEKGKENETWYPSTINYYGEEEYSEHMRVFKFDDIKDTDGFILLSDGAEKSLVKMNDDPESSLFSALNASIPFDIAKDETTEDGCRYLENLIETQYRVLESGKDTAFITDDDCSVAVIAKENVSIIKTVSPSKKIIENYGSQPEEVALEESKSKTKEIHEEKQKENPVELDKKFEVRLRSLFSSTYSEDKKHFILLAFSNINKKLKGGKITVEEAGKIIKKTEGYDKFQRTSSTIVEFLLLLGMIK